MYVAKRQAEAARTGEDKPFSSAASDEAHNQMSLLGNTASAVPAPLSNQMLNLLVGYLNNIAIAATQAVAKGCLPV